MGKLIIKLGAFFALIDWLGKADIRVLIAGSAVALGLILWTDLWFSPSAAKKG